MRRLSRGILWVAATTFLLGIPGFCPARQAGKPAGSDADTVREKRIMSSLALLEHGNEDEQGAAIYLLAQCKLPPEQGIPLFQAHLRIRTGTISEALLIAHSLEGLAAYGPAARHTLPDLIRLLDQTGTVQGEAAYGGQMWEWLVTAMSKIGPEDHATVSALQRAMKRCLKSPERLDILTVVTAQALGNMGRSAHTAVPLLALALGRVPFATSSIAFALSRMMPEAVLAIPALLRTLDSNQSPDEIVEALGTMGPAAKSALPALHRRLTDPSPTLACKAFAAIAHIEGEPTVTPKEAATILQEIDKQRIPAIYAAFSAINLQGTKAEAAVPVLVQIVDTRKEAWLRRTAVETLAAVGPAENRDAALVLIAAAHQQDPKIALDVTQAFQKFGTAAKLVIPELSALLLAGERERNQALTLLYSLGPKAAPAVPNLTKLLREEAKGTKNSDTTTHVLWLLQNIGPDAQEAAPVLTDLILEAEKEPRTAESYRRTALLKTLMSIGITPRVLPAIREMLASNQPLTVACAAHAVALLGRQAADTVPLLLRPLRPGYKDSAMTSGFFYGYVYETTARNECMRALASLGPEAKEALPVLQPYADLPEEPVGNSRYGPPSLKAEAQRAIQAIQPKAGT